MVLAMARGEAGEKVLATNRKAFFRYEVLERAEAGLALAGTEVKAIRDGGLSFADSWVEFRGGEMFLVGCRIAPYSHGNLMNHAPERDRWFLFRSGRIHDAIDAWLEEHGVRSTEPPPWK